MTAAERETKQVLSALLQKPRLKINIVAYGTSTAKSVSPTSKIGP